MFFNPGLILFFPRITSLSRRIDIAFALHDAVGLEIAQIIALMPMALQVEHCLAVLPLPAEHICASLSAPPQKGAGSVYDVLTSARFIGLVTAVKECGLGRPWSDHLCFEYPKV
ncbi:hypothetical protein TNCV_1232211 [Trichonephila clavipes]|nr:hypothetical protein TNCV_1232211 [Trichonephila clavipes]